MTDRESRERLVELIVDAVGGNAKHRLWGEVIADHLLANGVIVPPCKVGDTVYLPIKTDWGTVENYEIVEVGRDRYGKYFRVYDEEQEKTYLEEIGKTVFLTKEEAEEKLKECEGK